MWDDVKMSSDYDAIELTEDEKLILRIIGELSTRLKDPNTKEITITENLKITLTGEGIKKLKMISEKNIDSDTAIKSLITKGLINSDDLDLQLTEKGKRIAEDIRKDLLSTWYNDHLLRCANSNAYGLFCERVFGQNLYQFNVLDMEQLNALITAFKLNSDDTVLDLGCGLGKIAEYIHIKTGALITGIDFAPNLIQWAREHTENKNNLKFQVGDINNLDFAPASFNAIYAVDTLYPTNVTDLNTTIAKLKSLLKPNGQLGIFFAQIIESKEQEEILEPNNTKMAQALKENDLTFTVIDFTKNARTIWDKEIAIGNELLSKFEEENNRDLCEERIADGKRCIYRIDNQLQKRYFYHVSVS